MKHQKENPDDIVNRFLKELGEPLSSNDQVKHATNRVLDNLRADPFERSLEDPVDAPRPILTRRWGAIAAAAAVLLVTAVLQFAFLQLIDDDSAVAKTAAGQLLLPGHLFRADNTAGVMLSLADGSRVEMSPGAELSIDRSADGIRVRLAAGNVIVTAARQRNGHFYVETRDCTVSVVGTVFSVNAEAAGSRVSVIEGEVHVQQGKTSQVLMSGEQVFTNSTMGSVPVPVEIGWSQNAPGLLALLSQAAPPAVSPAPQTQAGVVRGTVIRRDTSEGVADVAISLCLATERAVVSQEVPRLPSRDQVTSIRIGGDTGVAVIQQREGTLVTLQHSAGCSKPISATTDAMGRFAITDVPPGQYLLRAQRDGYFGASREPQVNPGFASFASQAITVDARQPTPEITLSLIRGGAIGGRIRSAEGRLIPNAVVRAVQPLVQSGTSTFRTIATRQTDDRGEYRLFSLPPGEYYVVADPPGQPQYRGEITLTLTDPATGRPTVQAPRDVLANGQTFYPQSASLAEGTPVALNEGEEVSAIDIVLPPSPQAPPR